MYQPILGVPMGGGAGASAPTPLPNGVYYQPSLTTAPPLTGHGWIAGPPCPAEQFSVTTLIVQNSGTVSGYESVADFNGTIASDVGFYWDGSAAQSIAISLLTPWVPHIVYEEDTNAQTFDAPTPATIAIYRQLVCDSDTGGVLTVTSFTL